MTATEKLVSNTQAQPAPVKVDSISEDKYIHYTSAKPVKTDMLSFSDWAQREQVRLLRTINAKLTFFTVLVILAMIISFIQALSR